MWEDIKAAIDQAIKDHVPTKRTPARHTHPWVDTHLRRASRRKNRAFHKVKQTKSPVDWNRFKRLRMQAQKDMRHTGKCIRRFGGIYAYCQDFIDRKW